MMEISNKITEYDDLLVEFSRIEREEALRRRSLDDNKNRLQADWDKLVKIKQQVSYVKSAIEGATIEKIQEEGSAICDLDGACPSPIRDMLRYKETMKQHIAAIEEQLLSVRENMAYKADELSRISEKLNSSSEVRRKL